jgi:hypothetical protein
MGEGWNASEFLQVNMGENVYLEDQEGNGE